MEYKVLTPADLKTLREMNVVFSDAFEEPEVHLSKPPSDAYLLQLLAGTTFIAIAAIQNEKVVGGLVAYVLEKYEQERSEIYIYDLAVEFNHRRQGIARGLILKLKAIAKNYKGWVIFVQADKVDGPAIQLYESMGTREEPIHFDIPVD